MNIFKSETAPYFILILVSAIGWYLSQIVEETEKTPALAYSIEHNPDQKLYIVQLKNASRSQALTELKFSIVCKTDQPCFGKVPGGTDQTNFTQVVARTPVAPKWVGAERWDVNEIGYRVTLPAKGVAEIVVYMAIDDPTKVAFFYAPDLANPVYLYMFESGSIFGFLVEWYIQVLVWGFFGFVVLFLIGVAPSFYRAYFKEDKDAEKRGPEPQFHHLTVVLRDPDDHRDPFGASRGG